MKAKVLQLFWFGVFALMAGRYPEPTQAQQYTITKVDTLGGASGVALAVNDLGQVTGSADTPEGQRHAYLWAAGEIIDLGSFPPFAQSEAWGINNVGQVVGIATNSGDYSHGFLWENGKMIDLGDLVDPGELDTDAIGVNDSGQVVGVSQIAFKEWYAFVWEKGTMTGIPSQLGGTGSRALDVNTAGHFVGGAATRTESHAFLMMDGVMSDLGTLGGEFSRAYGVNDFDQVVGRSERPEGGNIYHAFLWEKGKMIDLGKIGGFASSWACAINNGGQVIGVPPFLYHPDTGMQNLADLLPPDTEWIGLFPRDINNVGQIVGSGGFQGSPGKAFLMTPIDADFNDDGDVDLADFACFQICFTGPELPPGEECPS
ncbi:MAG: hypothetical protein IID36_00005, partial [Planctomycetes bacterium]|nr:hypothetical protein [Planctomycetota bacterium]